VIDCRSLVLEHGIDEVMPDGIHFNERGHDLVAARLEWEVLDWLKRTGRIRQHQHA
jgi:lysophospholipase L1-like esterase